MERQVIKIQEGRKEPIEVTHGSILISDDTEKSEYQVTVGTGTECHILRMGLGSETNTKICTVIEPGGVCTIDGVFITGNAKASFESSIQGDGGSVHTHILGLAGDGETLDISANIEVPENIHDFRAFVRQNNTLIGVGGKIRGLPILKISSNDGEAGHSCTVSRIPREHLFYLTSHGLSEHHAGSLILEGLIEKRLQCFVGTDEYEDIKTRIITCFIRKYEGEGGREV